MTQRVRCDILFHSFSFIIINSLLSGTNKKTYSRPGEIAWKDSRWFSNGSNWGIITLIIFPSSLSLLPSFLSFFPLSFFAFLFPYYPTLLLFLILIYRFKTMKPNAVVTKQNWHHTNLQQNKNKSTCNNFTDKLLSFNDKSKKEAN